jgi:hypothetical protein
MKAHAENFKKIHKKTFVKNNKAFAIEKRKFAAPEKLLINIAKNQFARERSKSIKIRIL